MNKLKGWLALVLLLLSWCALYWITGSRTPWNQFHVNNDGSGVSVYLGDIPTQNYDRMGFTKAVVRYAAEEEGWIVGTERGELFLFDNEGRQKWKRSLGIGKLIALCLTPDGKLAIVGEQSAEGRLYAVDVHTGISVGSIRVLISSALMLRSVPILPWCISQSIRKTMSMPMPTVF